MAAGEWEALFEGLDASATLAEDWLEGLGFNPGAPAEVLTRLFDYRTSHRFMGRADLPDGVLDAAVAHPAKTVWASAAEWGRLNDRQWERLLSALTPTALGGAVAELREDMARDRATWSDTRGRGVERPPFPGAEPPSTPEEIAVLADAVPDIGSDDRSYALWWIAALHDDPEAMRQLAQSPNLWIRRSVARARHLPPDVVARLGRDEDRVVQLFLTESCDDAPAETLLEVWSWWPGSFTFPGRPRNHPNFPREDLLAYADDPRPRVRVLALEDSASTADLVERFSRDPAAETRAGAAADPRLSAESAARLAEDEAREVRRAAFGNPSLPVRILVGVLRGAATAGLGARNPGIPVPVMHRMIDLAGPILGPSRPYPGFTPSPSPR